MTRFVVPGSASVKIDKPANKTIFYEYKSSLNGRTFDTPKALTNLQVTVTGPDGGPVKVKQPRIDETYSSGRSGRAVLTFHPRRAGYYKVSANYVGPNQGDRVLAVGELGLGKILISAFLVILLCGLIAVIIAVVNGVRLVRWRQAKQRQPQ